MKQKINVIMISILAVVLLIVSFFFAIKYRKQNMSYFMDNGYIISNLNESGKDKVNKLFFNNETSYKNSNSDKITFTNTEGDKVAVPGESFVHYNSGAIMSLKKGVAIDLDDITSKIISYYNIFEGSVLNKKNESYEINNMGKPINFSKLMFKISNTKYLVASKKIIVSFSDSQTLEFENFAEIEYINENVIKIYNGENNYQTIASNLYLIIDDVKIDLEYKTISKGNKVYLTMADMVINSDDNIEVLPKKEEVKLPENESNNIDNGNNSNNGNNNNGGGNNNNNSGNTGTNDNVDEGLDNLINNLPSENEQVDVQDEFMQPKFTIKRMTVNTLGFTNLEIEFEDESNVLYGDRTVEIIENSTGKLVETFDIWEEGKQKYVQEAYYALKPNTAYTLNVSGQYKIEDTVYDRIFVSKIFRTLDLGIEVLEDLVTANSLSYAVYKNSSSNVDGFTYNVTDKSGKIVVQDTTIKYGSLDAVIISTESVKLNPNTQYVLTIKDIAYDSTIFLTSEYHKSFLTYESRTLKQNPFKNNIDLAIDVNNQNNLVSFSVDGINDVGSGIINYTYNIYNEFNQLLYSIVKDTSEPLELDIDEYFVEKNETENQNETSNEIENEIKLINEVYFEVVVNFDDNEKTIIYTTNKSSKKSLTDFVYPYVINYSFDDNNTYYETMHGYIVISDKTNFIPSGIASRYRVEIKERDGIYTGNTNQVYINFIKKQEDNGLVYLPIYFENLIPQREYILSVFLEKWVGEEKHDLYLGYATAKTLDVTPVYLKIDDSEENLNDSIFDFRVSLNDEMNNVSAANLARIDFELRGCTSEYTPINECTVLESHMATLPKNQNSQALASAFKEPGYIDVYSSDFDFEIGDFKTEYKAYKVSAKGYGSILNYDIPIFINDDKNNEYTIKFNEIDPGLTINDSRVLNSDCKNEKLQSFYDERLDEETTVGWKFEIESHKNPLGEYISKISFKVQRMDDNGEWVDCVKSENQGDCVIKPEDLIVNDNIKNIEYSDNGYTILDISDNVSSDFVLRLERGFKYQLIYYGIYNKDNVTFINLDEVKIEDIELEKQKAKISGYQSGYYRTKDITQNYTYSTQFKLNITDVDEVIENIYLVNVSNEEDIRRLCSDNNSECKYDTGVYTVDNINNVATYLLRMDYKISNWSEKGEILKSAKLYDVNFEQIVEPDEFEFLAQASEIPGRIELSVKTNENNKSRVSGFLIDNKFYELKVDADDVYARTQLNISEIKDVLGRLDSTNNKFIFEKDIYFVYDSGEIINPFNVTEFFPKWKNLGENKFLYYDHEKSDFVENLKYNFGKFTDIKNMIEEKKYDYYDDNSRIGLKLNSKTVIMNNASKIKFEGTGDGGKVTVTNIKEGLYTDKVDKVYTSSGAKINFTVKGNTALLSSLKVQLGNTCGNAQSNITKSENNVLIEFTNLPGKDELKCTYSVLYTNSGSNYAVYDEELKSEMSNLIIEKLIDLPIQNKQINYDKTYWHYNENYTDILFDKLLKYSFDVESQKYELSNNETIIYDVIAVKNLDNSNSEERVLIAKNKIIPKTGENKIIDVIDLSAYSDIVDENNYLNGVYKIILQPKLKIGQQIENLNEIILSETETINRSESGVTIINNGTPEFTIKITDVDGRLKEISKDELATKLSIENMPDGPIINVDKKGYTGNKNVYFTLFSIDESGNEKEFLGYVGIPFVEKNIFLDLKTYFKNNIDSLVGNYVVKMVYKYGTDLVVKTFEYKIENRDLLNIKLMEWPNIYLLNLINPNDDFRRSIASIKYSYSVNGAVRNGNFTVNDEFWLNTSETSTGITYLIPISIPENTSVITNFQVDFYDENDQTIYTYIKK